MWWPNDEWGEPESDVIPHLFQQQTISNNSDPSVTEQLPRTTEPTEGSRRLLFELVRGIQKHPGFFDLTVFEEDEPESKRQKMTLPPSVPFPRLLDTMDSSSLTINAGIGDVESIPQRHSPLIPINLESCNTAVSPLNELASMLNEDVPSEESFLKFGLEVANILRGKSVSERMNIVTQMEESMDTSGADPQFHTVTIRDRQSDSLSHFCVPKRYTNLQFLNAGAQGTVVSAEDIVTKTKVAIKKMQQPFIMTMSAKRAYREFMLLSSIRHPNIIKMLSAFSPQRTREDFKEVYLVMELMNHNLHEVITRLRLDHKTLSFFVYQMLCAINHLHITGIIHRDLKPTNMVVDERCILKILDFGLARKMARQDNAMRMSDYVVTRYYRAPEVTLGMVYTEKVDIWSIGCIFAEMINHHVLFPGRDRVDQWSKIVHIRGTPNEEFIRRLGDPAATYVRSLPTREPMNPADVVPDSNFLQNTEEVQANLTAVAARDLLFRMLAIVPEERYSVQEALAHPYVKLWFKDEEVNAPASVNRYNSELDFADRRLQEWKDLIFDEVKQFESTNDVFGGV